MAVQPLIWLLVFVFVVALVAAGVKLLGIPIHPRLEQVLIALVILIVVIVFIGWLLGVLGVSLGGFMEPLGHRR